jgi:hypothetical protein
MNRYDGQSKNFRRTLSQGESDKNEPGNPAQRQSQRDRIRVAAHKSAPRAQSVQRAAKQREVRNA